MASSCWGIVLATGKDQELVTGAETAFLGVGSRPMLAHVLDAFERCKEIEGVIVVASRDRVDMVRALAYRFGCAKVRHVVPGAANRRGSVEAALKLLEDDVDFVTIHDVCRPCVTATMIVSTITAARRSGAAIVATAIREPVKKSLRGTTITGTWTEETLWTAQSPQTYRVELLQQGLAAARKQRLNADEESSAVGLVCDEIRLVEPGRWNLRIRTSEDLTVAAQLLM